MSDTIYSTEPVLFVSEPSWKKLLAEIASYEAKGWVSFDAPINVVYEKELRVGTAARRRRNGAKAGFMRRKENVGKEKDYYSDKPSEKKQ